MKTVVKVILAAPGQESSLDVALAVAAAIDVAKHRALGKPGSWDAPVRIGSTIIGRAEVRPVQEG